MKRSTKYQAPNNKYIPMTEIQNLKQKRFGHLILGFGIYLGFGFCNLEFPQQG
jgi:hypothetical protein